MSLPYVQRARTLTARFVRRGSQHVLLTPNPGPRFGNFLYYWLHAHLRVRSGVKYRVQVHDHLYDWLEGLPAVQEHLCTTAESLGFFDRREWPPARQFQVMGRDYLWDDIEEFVQQWLLFSPLMSDPEPMVESEAIINIRRGDYYSNPQFRALYGINVKQYLATALEALPESALRDVTVVSDDSSWCRANLDSLLSPTCDRLRYVGQEKTPQDHFRLLSRARWIVGSNSTFSYWGAYVATVRNPESQVVMPRFRTSAIPGGGAYQLPSHWTIIETIPGGWQGQVGP